MNKLPRVLMFVPQYPYPVLGGLEKQSHLLSKALMTQGLVVQVISGKINPGQPDNELVEGVPVTRLFWSGLKPLRFALAPFSIAKQLWAKSSTFDVIHLHQCSWVGLFVIVLAKLLGKPILTKLASVGYGGLPGMRRKVFGWLRLAIFSKSDAIVAMSAESLQELMAVSYPVARVLLTPNGIDLNDPPPLRLQAGAAPCRVVFVGRLTQEKNINVLLKAWARVIAAGVENVTLTLYGDGPLLGALQHQCAELDLIGNVIFAGLVENIKDRLPGMDVFVLPSSVEGNSNAILEAMRAGLPIVSTMAGGTPMLVGEEGRAFLSAPGDIDALYMHLLILIKNRSLRLTSGLAMRRRVEQHFDIMQVAQTYSKAYGFLAARERDRISEVANPVILNEV